MRHQVWDPPLIINRPGPGRSGQELKQENLDMFISHSGVSPRARNLKELTQTTITKAR